jgi:hypothetical protein
MNTILLSKRHSGQSRIKKEKKRGQSRIIAYYCFLLAERSRFPREHAALILNRRAITLARQHCWNMAMPGTGLPAFDGTAFMQRSVYNSMIYMLLRIFLDKALV